MLATLKLTAVVNSKEIDHETSFFFELTHTFCSKKVVFSCWEGVTVDTQVRVESMNYARNLIQFHSDQKGRENSKIAKIYLTPKAYVG